MIFTKRRNLTAPTIFALLLLGLIVDDLYFSDSPWSVARVLGKVAAVLMAIFAPAFTPATYGWITDLTVPVAIVGLGVILLVLSIGRAKSAMRQATPDAVAAAPTQPQNTAGSAPTLASVKPALFETRAPHNFGLVGKLTFCFGIVGILFGFAVCVIVHAYLSRVLEREIKSRAEVMALGLNDMAARYLTGENLPELGGKIARYASAHPMIAYIYVEDAGGEIIAHDPKDLPIYLIRDFPRSSELALNGVDRQYRDFAVFEIAKRTAPAKGGFVHLGLWRNAINGEARRAVASIAVTIIVLLTGALGVFVLIAQFLNRPLLNLVDHAQRISKGEFAVPLELKRADEIGEIARSLERMRSSLRAVGARLEQS